MKATDEQIKEVRILQLAKKLTVVEACKQLGISKPSYYSRIKSIAKKDKTNTKLAKTLPLTIEQLDTEAKVILDDLKQLKDSEDYDKLESRVINAEAEARLATAVALAEPKVKKMTKQNKFKYCTKPKGGSCPREFAYTTLLCKYCPFWRKDEEKEMG